MTDTAKTALANNALAHLGEDRIDDITLDPPSPRIAKILGQLDGPAGVHAWAIKRHPWLCALTYQTLSPTPDLSNWKWLYVFALPDTFSRLWECTSSSFQVGTLTDGAGATIKVVFSNDATLDVAYTELRPFEAYDTDVAAVIAYELASRTAGPIKNDYELAARLHEKAKEAIDMAQGAEAGQHGSDQAMVPSVLAQARRFGSF